MAIPAAAGKLKLPESVVDSDHAAHILRMTLSPREKKGNVSMRTEGEQSRGLQVMFALCTSLAQSFTTMEDDINNLSRDEVMKKAHERGESVDSLLKLVNKLPMKSNELLEMVTVIKTTGKEVDSAEAEYLDHIGHPQFADKLVAAVKKNTTAIEEFLVLLVSLRKEFDKSKNVENLDIWTDPVKLKKNLILDGHKHVLNGGLNQLITHLTDPNNQDVRFAKVFIFMYRLFTTPLTLIDKILARYDVPSSLNHGMEASEFRTSVVQPIQQRVYVIIRLWVTYCFEDFSMNVLRRLHEYIDNLKSDGYKKEAMSLLDFVNLKVSQRTVRVVPTFPSPPKGLIPFEYLANTDPILLADQFSIFFDQLAMNLYHREFASYAIGGHTQEFACPQIEMILMASRSISMWIQSTLVAVESLKSRTSLVAKYLQIVDRARQMQCYQAMYAVMEAFNAPAISRLQWSFDTLHVDSRKILMSAQSFLDPSSEYKSYKGGLIAKQPPAVPIVQVTLEDINRLDEEVTKSNHLINFRKCDAIWTAIEEYFRLRKGTLPLHEDSVVLSCIASLARTNMAQYEITEGSLMEQSLLVEPPNAPLQSLKH
mmetsp:Transcript_27948/g.70126  ORF Transcript_27948/g.70126 Transcript_27948/m.70126 type:complete len:595 (-) Transcript_27948:109-1893(-)